MLQQPFQFISVPFALLLGVGAIASGEPLFQLLGGLLLFVTFGMVVSEIRLRRSSTSLPVVEETPSKGAPPVAHGMPASSVSLGERVLPLVFYIATGIIVLAIAVYTAWLLGLW